MEDKAIRERLCLSISWVSGRTGLSRATVRAYERGDDLPSNIMRTMRMMYDAMIELLGWDKPKIWHAEPLPESVWLGGTEDTDNDAKALARRKERFENGRN